MERIGRLRSVDALRGLVIVLMALDHTRDFFHAGAMTGSPTDLAQTTPILFATRWVTHLCAPTFAWLAGVGAWLRLQRPGETRASLSRYLLVRGAWLVALEVVVMNAAITFSLPGAYPILLLVLWSLGLSMVGLAALVWVPVRPLLMASVLVVAGHNLLDGVSAASLGAFAGLWRVLHEPGVVSAAGVVAIVGYPLVPWVAVMAAGFASGPLFALPADRRTARLAIVGVALCALFVVVRAANAYGDPAPWRPQGTVAFTLLSFLNTTKYPPSLAFLLMTLGPACLILAWLERRTPRDGHPLVVLGRVPLFFYVAHFWVLHAMVVALALVVYGRSAWGFAFMPVPSMGGPASAFPSGFGYALWVTYVVWVSVVVLLWPVCRWLAARRPRRASPPSAGPPSSFPAEHA